MCVSVQLIANGMFQRILKVLLKYKLIKKEEYMLHNLEIYIYIYIYIYINCHYVNILSITIHIFINLSSFDIEIQS